MSRERSTDDINITIQGPSSTPLDVVQPQHTYYQNLEYNDPVLPNYPITVMVAIKNFGNEGDPVKVVVQADMNYYDPIFTDQFTRVMFGQERAMAKYDVLKSLVHPNTAIFVTDAPAQKVKPVDPVPVYLQLPNFLQHQTCATFQYIYPSQHDNQGMREIFNTSAEYSVSLLHLSSTGTSTYQNSHSVFNYTRGLSKYGFMNSFFLHLCSSLQQVSMIALK
jgi:hypothetical protein